MLTPNQESEFMAGKPTLYADALAAALADTFPVTGTEIVTLAQARGRLLAEPVMARLDMPRADNSAMDGYGVAVDSLACGAGGLRLQVRGASLAGHPHPGPVAPATAIRIATGAVIPQGVDAVVIQEDVAAGSGEQGFIELTPEIVAETEIGQHIRRCGEDVRAGEILLTPGHRLRPQDLSIVASQGIDAVTVWRKLKVAVYATGDELREAGQILEAGQIYESNRVAVIGVLEEMGAMVTNLGLLADDFDTLQTALRIAAQTHDVIITSGGVSVGTKDLLKPVVESLGRIQAWQIAMKPGKPLMRGKIGDCLVLGLPGNPVSAMVGMLVFARPLLTRLMGGRAETARGLSVTSGFDWTRRPGRREWLRARLEQDASGQWVAQMYRANGSHLIRSMVWAEGLIEVPEKTGRITRGEKLHYIPLSGF